MTINHSTSLWPNLHLLIPIFNDWESVNKLLHQINDVLTPFGAADVLLLDDGSTFSWRGMIQLSGLDSLSRVEVLELNRNMGHQRAIAVGLAWLHANRPERHVLIMDGDGEDNPGDIPQLVQNIMNHPEHQVVFAARSRRLEGWTFQFFYRCFQALHWMLTGYPVRVGNFSIMTPAALRRLIVMCETWSHYAAAVFVSRMPFSMVPLARSLRLAGRSHMNFTSLVIHGLSALSVYNHIIGVRLLCLLIILSVIFGLVLLALVTCAITFGAIPWWLAVVSGLVFYVLLQHALLGLLFMLLVLGNRQGSNVMPARDFHYYVRQVVVVEQ